MKNKFKWILVSVMLAAVIAFAGCATTTDGPTNFSSQAEADAAVAQNALNFLYIVYAESDAADQALYFNGSFNNERKSQALHQPLRKAGSTTSAVYDSLTGFWTDDYTQGDSLGEHYKIKFTPRNTFGLPDATTNAMTYSHDYNEGYTTAPYFYTDNFHLALDATGIAGYRNHTGNLSINGSLDFSLQNTNLLNSSSIDIVFTSDFHSLAVSPDSLYALQSGSVSFTVKFDTTPAGAVNYFVAGTLTFDGTHIVKLAIGGFNYNIDIDDSSITPA